MAAQLDKATQEVQMRERQINKIEQKVENEIQVQNDLKHQIEIHLQDLRKATEANTNLKQAYNLLENNYRTVEERLDHKVLKVDELEERLGK